jgi:GcrA cell cycle regulator
MQASEWAPAHCEALRYYLGLGMSFAETAREINAKFGTAYTRNAAIGRSKRMGLVVAERPRQASPATAKPRTVRTPKPSEPRAVESPRAQALRAQPLRLRCVGISPRLLSLIELEAGDCRYPYGGDKENEPIAFCGHPRLPGLSYCAPHFHLTRGPDAELERPAAAVVLRLVQAA